ncbi:hypothetical protein RFI_10319, partial [Reticulomyxa filosa]
EALLNEAFENDDVYDIDYDAHPIVPDPCSKKVPQNAQQWSDACPVVGCGAIFKTEMGLHIHTNKHIERNPNTVVLSHYFHIYKRVSCLHCRLSLPASSAVHGMHPKCSNRVHQPQIPRPDIEIDFNIPAELDNSDQWIFPKPEEIALYPAKIIPRIPKAARSHFASIASISLMDIANRNNKESWAKWMVMIRSILWAPSRGGRAHINNTTKTILDRIKLWRDKSYSQLWKDYLKHSNDIFEETKNRSTFSNKHNNVAARNKRCIKFAAIGELSKAFKSLTPSPNMQYNDNVITALRNKHPDELPPHEIVTSFAQNKDPRMPPIPIHKHITVEELSKYINKLSRSSSGGIDLFTAQHLRDLAPYQTESSTLTNWTKVAQLVIEGKVCMDAQAIAYGARLIAIPKPDNTPRPIAVGSLFRRSAGAILLQRHSENISKTLGPNQLGVNVKQGIEIFSHGLKAISRHIQANNKGVLVKIDFQNAFNACKRKKLLELVRMQVPELYGYAKGCYAKHAPLFLPTGHIILSKSGVHQGDPLGGTFFAIVLADALRLSTSPIPNLFHAAYHDDLTIAADDPQHVTQAVTALLDTAETHGTKINLNKCEWISNYQTPPPSHLKQIPHNITYNTTIVGVPIGDEEYVQKEMDVIVQEWSTQFENLLSLKHAQTMLLLLRNSLNATKATFHMRANFIKAPQNWTNTFDQKMKHTMETILACPLTNNQWLQCQMPTKRGGLGLNSANALSSSAYIASAQSASQRLPIINPHIQNVEWLPQNEFESAVSHYNTNTQQHNNIIDIAFIPSQARLAKNVTSRIQGEFRDKLTPEHRTLVKAVSKPYASGYLNALPNKFQRSLFDNREIRALLRFRLGQKQTFNAKCQANPACSIPMDILGNHALSCHFGKGRIARHDGIVACIANFLKRAAIPHEREVRANQETNHRPGDICLRWFGDDFEQKCLDIGITHQNIINQQVHKGNNTDNWALERYRRVKIMKHRLRCEQAGKSFTPLIAEATGGWQQDARDFFDKLAQVISDKDGDDLCKVKDQVYNTLSIQLQKGNARLLNSHCA